MSKYAAEKKEPIPNVWKGTTLGSIKNLQLVLQKMMILEKDKRRFVNAWHHAKKEKGIYLLGKII